MHDSGFQPGDSFAVWNCSDTPVSARKYMSGPPDRIITLVRSHERRGGYRHWDLHIIDLNPTSHHEVKARMQHGFSEPDGIMHGLRSGGVQFEAWRRIE